MKKLTMMAIAVLLMTAASYATYPVLKREVCGIGIFGAHYSKSTLTTFSVEGGSRKGYDVYCEGSGLAKCPRLGAEIRPDSPEDEWDEVQIVKIYELLEYAYEQMAAGNANGSYVINVQVEGEENRRRYELDWSSRGTEDFSTIIISRDDF